MAKGNRGIIYLLSLFLIISMVICGIPVSEVRADTSVYNHIIPFTVTDTSGVARTNVPIIITFDVDGNLVDYGLVNATATDTYVDSSGAGNSPVGSGTAYDFLMATSNITVVIPTLPAYGSYTVNLYTGYSPVQTAFPIIFGDGSYFTVSDNDTLEPSDNFSLEMNGYFDTSASAVGANIANKADVLRVYISGTSNITASMPGEDFTTYTEVDVPGKLTVTSTKATGAAVDGDESVYLYKDYGSDYFDALDVDFELYITDDTQDAGLGGVAITNTIATVAGLAATDVVAYTQFTGANYVVKLVRGSNDAIDTYIGSHSTLYYCTMTRVAGNDTVNLLIYSDTTRDTLLDTLTVAGYGTEKWQYAFGFINNFSTVGGRNWYGYTQNLDLGVETTSVTATSVSSGEYELEVSGEPALDFDGTNDYVDLGAPADLVLTTLSIVAYVKRGAIGATQFILGSEAQGYGFYFNPTDKLAFGRVGATEVLSAGNITDTTEWHQVAVTFNGGTLETKFYIDGSLDRTTTLADAAFASGVDRAFGIRPDGLTSDYNGSISEVRIYNRVLTDIYDTSTTGLVGYWAINEGTGTDVADSSGNSNDGTVEGTGGWTEDTLKIIIDSVTRDIDELGTALDTDDNWTFCQSAVTPYTDNITLDVGGTQQLYFAPNALIDGTTLPDRESTGGDNDGTITWGTNSGMEITGGSIMDSESATSVGTTAALMQGELFDIGTYTTVYLSFEYGLNDDYGYYTSETSATGEQTHSVTLTGLTPNTTYHYRALSRVGVVYSYGADTTFTTTASTASEGSIIPLIREVGVFKTYKATGDWLFCAEVFVTYPPYYPTGIPAEYFQVQLLSTDGATILGASPLRQWGDRPASIYFNTSGNITDDSAYIVKVLNISSENITATANETLVSADWHGDDLERLDEWCIGVAINMQGTDGTILTDPYVQSGADYGIIITDTAGGFFSIGIPEITQVRPNLFSTAEEEFAIDTLSSDIDYNTGVTLTDRVGATIVADAETVGDILDLTGEQFLLYTILAVVIGCIIFTISSTRGFGALGALCISVPIIGASNYFTITPIMFIVLIAIIFVFLFVRQFVWKTM